MNILEKNKQKYNIYEEEIEYEEEIKYENEETDFLMEEKYLKIKNDIKRKDFFFTNFRDENLIYNDMEYLSNDILNELKSYVLENNIFFDINLDTEDVKELILNNLS